MNSVVRDIAIEREISPADFRGAMRQLTGGVSVITAGRGRDISGMTVTSVSSSIRTVMPSGSIQQAQTASEIAVSNALATRCLVDACPARSGGIA